MKAENDEQVARAKTAREKATILFPLETWREIEPRIFIAGSREPKVKNQQQVLEAETAFPKELVQARILTAQGSTVYLLPEIAGPDNIGVKHPDAIVDGYLMEFKTITGSINQVEHRFRESRKKAEYVFFKIDSHLAQETVLRYPSNLTSQHLTFQGSKASQSARDEASGACSKTYVK